MKPQLQARMTQQLALTPQLQQAIRLLQLSAQELAEEIEKSIESNPLLEYCDPNDDITSETPSLTTPMDQTNPSIEETLPAATTSIEQHDVIAEEDSWQGESSAFSHADDDWDPTSEMKDPAAQGLRQHLIWQMQLTPLSPLDKAIATAIIDAINEDGYLTIDLADIQASLGAVNANVELDEIEAVLHRVQQFDPLGVGSRTLQEFLLLQLKQLPATPVHQDATRVITLHLDWLAQHDDKRLKQCYHWDDAHLSAVVTCIRSLSPRPCYGFVTEDATYTIPDVVISKQREGWVVELNHENTPKIRINAQYEALVKGPRNQPYSQQLREQWQEARWLMKCLQSRNETLLKVATCIMQHQHAFLEHGDIAMQPLILQAIAQATDLHESTVSRVTSKKYIQTPRGVYELKYFFSSHVSTQAGKDYSSTALRALIKQFIDNEEPKKPLSDNTIAQYINTQCGLTLARRTVTKYREAMGIGTSTERKQQASFVKGRKAPAIPTL